MQRAQHGDHADLCRCNPRTCSTSHHGAIDPIVDQAFAIMFVHDTGPSPEPAFVLARDRQILCNTRRPPCHGYVRHWHPSARQPPIRSKFGLLMMRQVVDVCTSFTNELNEFGPDYRYFANSKKTWFIVQEKHLPMATELLLTLD